jgi:hypothetical protein
MGTLMCHRATRPTAIRWPMWAARTSRRTSISPAWPSPRRRPGLATLGYTSQARFLMNCGIVGLMDRPRCRAQPSLKLLVHEHEMGELFKVIAVYRKDGWEPLGLPRGDRSHTL